MKKDKLTTFAFIDATNIIYGASNYGWQMDFNKLINYLKERFHCTKIFYYAGIDNKNTKQLKFYKKLQQFGYELRLVPVKIFKDGKKKADVDSRMTFEMMKYILKYDQAVVMSGDGDYYWVLKYLITTKNRIFLISHRQNTALELKKLFSYRYISLDDIKHRLVLNQTKTPQKRGNAEVNPTNVFTSQDYKESLPKIKSSVKLKTK